VVRTDINHALYGQGVDCNKLKGDTEPIRAEAERRLEKFGQEAFETWFAHQPSSPDPTVRPEGWELHGLTLPWHRTFEIGLDLCVGVEASQAKGQAVD